MIRRGIGVQSFVSAGGVSDADAQAVITAIESTGVTLTATQKTACNTLVTDLKGYGIWTKLKAVYGFLGGTAGAHKWNWKDPRDLDAAFRLVFSGGITHSSTGMDGNGTNGYGDTKLNTLSILSINSSHISVYTRETTVSASTYPVDAGVEITNNGLLVTQKMTGDGGQQFHGRAYNQRLDLVDGNNIAGLHIVTRTSSTSLKYIRNGAVIQTNTNTETGSRPNYNVFLSALNNTGSPSLYSDRQLAFASIGDGLTETEAANLYTAVQAYQTSLSRNV